MVSVFFFQFFKIIIHKLAYGAIDGGTGQPIGTTLKGELLKLSQQKFVGIFFALK